MADLRIITGPCRDTVFDLNKNGLGQSLGRGQEADFRLQDKAVSRKHAEIFFRDGQWFIRDIESANGTFINEQRLAEPTPLKSGDQIRCGATVLLYESPAEQPAPKTARAGTVELEFDPGETMIAVAFEQGQSRQLSRQQQRIFQAGQAALTMSHGIKNLLQAVSTGRDVMDSALAGGRIEQAKKGWNILKRNLEQIQKLVLDMLKFSKEQELALQPCQFHRLIESVVQLVAPQIQIRNVGVSLNLDERIGLVRLDPDRMQDVILNLLLNAIEACAPQTGHVTISSEIDTNISSLVLRIADNGPGINDLRTLFEPFHSTKGDMGVGLGLAIVRKVVLLHKGTIDAQSLPGEGTVFTVRIPHLPVES